MLFFFSNLSTEIKFHISPSSSFQSKSIFLSPFAEYQYTSSRSSNHSFVPLCFDVSKKSDSSTVYSYLNLSRQVCLARLLTSKVWSVHRTIKYTKLSLPPAYKFVTTVLWLTCIFKALLIYILAG